MPLGAVELYNSNSGAQIKRDGRSPRGRNSSGMCLLFLMSKHTLDRSPIKKKQKKKPSPKTCDSPESFKLAYLFKSGKTNKESESESETQNKRKATF